MPVRSASATYVYCVVEASRRPRAGSRAGVPGTGAVRCLPLDEISATRPRTASPGKDGERRRRTLWVAVADAPLDRFSEQAIARGLGDVDWVSRAAVAHQSVVESFRRSHALLPMRLFTIFSSDERVLKDLRGRRRRIETTLGRVEGHDEWGVRVSLDPARAARGAETGARPHGGRRTASGAGYLETKKAMRDIVSERATRAREVVTDLYDRLGTAASRALRRTVSETPGAGAGLLLDAVFLVSTTRSSRFRAHVGREAKKLAPHGYGVTLTGPWPPYSFVQDA